MAELVFKGGPHAGEVLLLKPGPNRIGRRPENDLAIANASVSGVHAEIVLEEGALRFRDLGSTNGSFVDGVRAQEAALSPGQILKLGAVELVVRADAVPPRNPSPITPLPPPVPKPGTAAETREPGADAALPKPQPGFPTAVLAAGTEDCCQHPGTPAEFVCQKCGGLFCQPCVKTQHMAGRAYRNCPACGGFCVHLAEHRKAVAREHMTFYGSLGSAFAYPLKGDGPWVLVGGTIYFTFLAWASWVFGTLGSVGIISGFYWIVMACGIGYQFAFMQSIIHATIHGEDRLPGWPEVTSVWDDVLMPFFRFAAIWAACLAPGIFSLVYGLIPLGIGLLALGVFCLPMAMLTVAIADSVAGLNPLIVFAAIGKLPGRYLVACGVFLLSLAFSAGLEWGLDALGLPIVPTVLGVFAGLYGLSVQMRVLGLLYFTSRDQLAWFK